MNQAYPIKYKLSQIPEEILDEFRGRSLSMANTESYNINFVPKPKPKDHKRIPSPMRLDSKSLRQLKKNQVSCVLLQQEILYFSSPEQDDLDSDHHTEETSSTNDFCPFGKANKKMSNEFEAEPIYSLEFETKFPKKYSLYASKDIEVAKDDEYMDLSRSKSYYIQDSLQNKMRTKSMLNYLEDKMEMIRKKSIN